MRYRDDNAVACTSFKAERRASLF